MTKQDGRQEYCPFSLAFSHRRHKNTTQNCTLTTMETATIIHQFSAFNLSKGKKWTTKGKNKKY